MISFENVNLPKLPKPLVKVDLSKATKLSVNYRPVALLSNIIESD